MLVMSLWRLSGARRCTSSIGNGGGFTACKRHSVVLGAEIHAIHVGEAALVLLPSALQVGGNGAFLVGRLREEVSGTADTPQAAAGAPSGEGGSGPSSSGAPSGGGSGRCLHRAAFGVLADTLDAIVCAAVRHGDWGVVEGALELGMQLYTHTGTGGMEIGMQLYSQTGVSGRSISEPIAVSVQTHT